MIPDADEKRPTENIKVQAAFFQNSCYQYNNASGSDYEGPDHGKSSKSHNKLTTLKGRAKAIYLSS